MSRLDSMSRFEEPSKRDEMYECYGCSEIFHYENLDEDGYCKECRREPADRDEEE